MRPEYPFDVKNNETGLIGGAVIPLAEIPSTNDYVRENARSLSSGTVVLAGAQTAGKGRLGRNWLSEPGNGIYLSVALKLPERHTLSSSPQLFSFFAALSVRRLLASLGLGARIKWPNDVLINGKKICGVLTEKLATANGEELIILGVGLNANNASFPQDLENRATSVRLETGTETDLAGLAFGLMLELDRDYARLLSGGSADILAEYRENCATIGGRVVFERSGVPAEGLATRVSDSGTLEILMDDGALTALASGETGFAALRPRPN